MVAETLTTPVAHEIASWLKPPADGVTAFPAAALTGKAPDWLPSWCVGMDPITPSLTAPPLLLLLQSIPPPLLSLIPLANTEWASPSSVGAS